ncbi:MAG: O-antigen ligase family protein [Candidatus Woykebacteria bacterium]
MLKLRNLTSVLKNPISLILIYIVLCGIVNARFIKFNDQAKDIALVAFLLITLLIYIIYSCRLKFSAFLHKVFTWPNRIILAYLTWSLITLGFAIDKKITLFYMIGGFLVFLTSFVLTKDLVNKDNFKKILYAVGATGLISVLYVLGTIILGITSPDFDPAFARVNLVIGSYTIYNLPFLFSYFEHPNTLGIALFFSISSFLTLALLEKNKILRMMLYLFSILLVLGLVLTFSRASILATSVFGLLIGYQALRKSNYLIPVFSTFLILVTILATLGAYQIFLVKEKSMVNTNKSKSLVKTENRWEIKKLSDEVNFQKPESGRKVVKSGLTSRGVLWRSAVEYIMGNPLVGAGFGNSEKAIESKIIPNNENLVGLTPHNTYLRVGVESGVTGLILYLTIMFYFFKSFFIRLRRLSVEEFATLSIVVSYLVLQFFEANFLFGTGFKSFYLLIFLAAGFAFINSKTYENINN